jgi:2-oxoglutarate ferredoxin oxidoreductase subunit beta
MSSQELARERAQAGTGDPAAGTDGAEGANGAAAQPGKRTAADYKGRIAPIWCPGCGNYAVLSAMQKAFANLDIDPDALAVVSGIGCSSRMPGFVKCYGYHGAHGRALPSAIGLKCGNPRMTVLVVGGDGDGLSIGMGHFPHAVRRNADITYLMLDNRIYGLTKGQTSPTTCQGMTTKTAPMGVLEMPMNPVRIAIGFDASFVARAYSGQPKQLQGMIEAALRHKGFSLVHVLSPCVTFGKGSGFDYFGPRVKPLPDDHDVSDMYAAMKASDECGDTIHTGIFYRREHPEYLEQLQARGGARGRELDAAQEPQIDVDALIERFS